MALISLMTGEIFASLRPVRKMVFGWPWARATAVAPPMLLEEGPVMMTGWVR